MLCKKCGFGIPNGSAFCPNCGEIVHRSDAQTVTQPKLEPEQPFYMPRAEDRPGLTEKPAKQELPIVKKRQYKALFISAGLLFAIFFLYGLYSAVFIEMDIQFDILLSNMREFGYEYLLLAGVLVLCVFCFVRGSRKPLSYLIPLGIIALAYIWMAVFYAILFSSYYLIEILFMLLIIVVLMLTVTGVIKSSIPALFLLLMHIGSDFYSLYIHFYSYGRDITFLDIMNDILPVLLCIGLLLVAEAHARKKTLFIHRDIERKSVEAE